MLTGRCRIALSSDGVMLALSGERPNAVHILRRCGPVRLAVVPLAGRDCFIGSGSSRAGRLPTLRALCMPWRSARTGAWSWRAIRPVFVVLFITAPLTSTGQLSWIDSSTWEVVRRVRYHRKDNVVCLVFTLCGRRCMSASNDHTAMVLNASDGGNINMPCASIHPSLTYFSIHHSLASIHHAHPSIHHSLPSMYHPHPSPTRVPGAVVAHLQGQHTDGVKACLFLHDDDFAVTAGADGCMWVDDLLLNRPVMTAAAWCGV